MERKIREKILGTLAPYVPKSEIEEVFGSGAITAFYDVLKTEGIPKYKESRRARRDKMLEDWKENEERLKEESINEAKRILNGTR